VSVPLFEAEKLSFAYGEGAALSDVSFTVAKGERFFIVGPNGAGKSTLIKIMGGLFRGEGRLLFEGRPLGDWRRRDLAKRVCYVPQGVDGGLAFTVRQFVGLARYPHLSFFSSHTAEDDTAIAAAIDRTGVTRLADRPMGRLSGGERQRALVAAALAQGADAMLMDEPGAYLDPKGNHDLTGLMKELNESLGVTLVVVTHDVNQAALHGDTTLGLRDGRVVYAGPAGDLMTGGRLAALYDRSFTLVPHPITGAPVVAPDPW
jgi:iron complex transport system ATP-binding protein